MKIYLLKCERMKRAERRFIHTLPEFLRWLEECIVAYGAIELLYLESEER